MHKFIPQNHLASLCFPDHPFSFSPLTERQTERKINKGKPRGDPQRQREEKLLGFGRLLVHITNIIALYGQKQQPCGCLNIPISGFSVLSRLGNEPYFRKNGTLKTSKLWITFPISGFLTSSFLTLSFLVSSLLALSFSVRYKDFLDYKDNIYI